MTDLERVARAINAKLGQDERYWNLAIPTARAAIEALMEPSADGLSILDIVPPQDVTCFRAMLTAILNEDGEKK